MSRRHGRDDFMIAGEGILELNAQGQPVKRKATAIEEVRKFRFSRMHPDPGQRPSKELLLKLANAMVAGEAGPDSDVPAGFTYLGQLVDHDLTLDKTARSLGDQVTVDELVQGRTPALDLDCLYGLGPVREPEFYSDGLHLKTGTSAATDPPAANRDLAGFDLPRLGVGSTKRERRQSNIPDRRNDENLIVAQTHAAFIRFHNRVIDKLADEGKTGDLFAQARDVVTKHYQWMLRHDFLPRIIDPAVLDDVFTNGRRVFEVEQTPPAGGAAAQYYPTTGNDRFGSMPIEFSVAAYRLGHSMIRGGYQWNRFFHTIPGVPALAEGSLFLLFKFSGTSGNLSPDGDPREADSGSFERLPTNWVADWRRLYDFTEAGRADLVPPPGTANFARPLDTRLVNPLKDLPAGSFGPQDPTGVPGEEFNLAFRNLIRGWMVALPSGQQMANLFVEAPLTSAQIVDGNGGAPLDLTAAERDELIANTPLWFYVLREAEVAGTGRLGAVGSRIVAETFHRSMETSQSSIVREPTWRPTLQGDGDTFRMVDLLLFAFEDKLELLNPLGDN